MDQTDCYCDVPRLTIGFWLSLRGYGHVGVLPFVWTHGGVLPLHHAAPPQGAIRGLRQGRGGKGEGVVVTVVMVACRTQHRLTDSRGSQGPDSVHESTARVLTHTHTHTSTHLLGCVRQQSVTLGNSLVNVCVCVFLFVCHSQSLYIFIILPPSCSDWHCWARHSWKEYNCISLQSP